MAHLFRDLLDYLSTHRLQLAKFILVGLATFGIYALSFHFFYGLAKLDYRLAATLAYLITICAHFVLNRSFTFKANEQEVIHNAWKYMLMLLFNYATLLVIMWICVSGIQSSPYLGVFLSTAVSMLMNFIIMKHFVFKKRNRKE